MKKTYEAPSVEKIAFMYRDQVVVASGGGSCTQHYKTDGDLVSNCIPTHWTGDNTAWN